jgi:phosphate acetyltransferase
MWPQAGIDLTGAEITSEPHSHAAAERAADMAASGDVEMLMKGSLHTDELIHAVLSKAVPAHRAAHVACVPV